MNLAQTLDIAARVMTRSAVLIHAPAPISDPALHAYWVYSRDLSHRWLQSLAVCQKVLESGDPIRSRQCWLEYEPDIREILRAEVLQRPWYAILRACDQYQGVCHAEPIARSALAAHMQARLRALKLVIAGHQFDASRMQGLNTLRKTTEAWSDLLCAHLAQRYGLEDVLYDASRARQWGEEPLACLLPELQIPGQASTLSEINTLLSRQTPQDFPLTPLQKLTSLLLNCFPPATFDGDLPRKLPR